VPWQLAHAAAMPRTCSSSALAQVADNAKAAPAVTLIHEFMSVFPLNLSVDSYVYKW
jgi:hypothetical protein